MMKNIPKLIVEKEYFAYLSLITFLSALLHELGHAVAAIMLGGRIVSFQLTYVLSEPRINDNPVFLLGGPAVTLLLCYLATYQFFRDRRNSNIWFATIFANLRVLQLAFYISSSSHDELRALSLLHISLPPLTFLLCNLIIYSIPILVLVEAPKLPLGKKLIFYLYNAAVIIAELKLLAILNNAICLNLYPNFCPTG